ncbi:MAG: hypothetical protein WCP32_12755, partial [Bacteroidota bacterium]
VKCVATSDFSCATGNPALSDAIVMSVTSANPAGITIAASANPVCTGSSVSYSASVVNAGSSPVFQWKINGAPVGVNQAFFTYNPVNGDIVTCLLTTNGICLSPIPVLSNQIVMVVTDQLVVSVSVFVTQNNVCEGTQVTFTASPVNGGVPLYQWYLNGLPVGLNESVFTYLPANGDIVYVAMTSSLMCVNTPTVSSNVIAMIVNSPLAVSASITVDQNPVCEGSMITFTATPVNGGTPYWQWFLNGIPTGFNQPFFSCSAKNGDQVYVKMTTSMSCVNNSTASSNMITMVVNSAVMAGVGIAVNQNSVCQGAEVIFTATPINGGNPTYHWYKNNLPVGSNNFQYSCVPLNGERIFVEMTSDLICATPFISISDVVEMVVNPRLSIGVDIVSDTNRVCRGTVVTFIATPVNGGSPDYHWYKNDLPVGMNQPVYSCVPDDADKVYVEMYSSLPCVNASSVISDAIRMVVDNPLEVEVTISSDQDVTCEGTTVTFTAAPVNGGSPVFRWLRNGIPSGSNNPQYSYVPSSGDRIKVEMTSSLLCVTSSTVTSNELSPAVKSLPAKALSITGASSVCAAAEGVVFSISPVADATSYIWNLPAGVTIAAGEHERSITLNFNESSNSGDISVFGNNECGNGAVSPTFQVEVIQAPETPAISREGNLIQSNAPTGNQWYFEGTMIQDSVSETIRPQLPGWYWSAVTENGCSSDTSNHIYFEGVSPVTPPIEPGFWVYPIPSDGQFTVKILLPTEDIFDIMIFNSLGMKIFELPGIVVKSKFKQLIDLRPKMPRGLFTVIFKCSGYQVVKKVLICNR